MYTFTFGWWFVSVSMVKEDENVARICCRHLNRHIHSLRIVIVNKVHVDFPFLICRCGGSSTTMIAVMGSRCRLYLERSWQHKPNWFGMFVDLYTSRLSLHIENHFQVVCEINASVGFGRGRSTGHCWFHRLCFGP